MKFKVGDKVKCIKIDDRPHFDLGHYGGGWKENCEFKIIRISNIDGEDSSLGLKVPLYWYKNQYGAELGVFEIALELSAGRKIEVAGFVKFLESIERK